MNVLKPVYLILALMALAPNAWAQQKRIAITMIVEVPQLLDVKRGLIEYGEAMLRGDAPRRAAARLAIHRSLGAAALVDAAAIVASINAVVKLADGSGIPLEDYKEKSTRTPRAELGLAGLHQGADPASHTRGAFPDARGSVILMV